MKAVTMIEEDDPSCSMSLVKLMKEKMHAKLTLYRRH